MSDGKTMMEQVTGAFLFPWPRKPLGKPDGKGKGSKPSGNRAQKSSKGPKQRGGPKQKKGQFGSWM